MAISQKSGRGEASGAAGLRRAMNGLKSEGAQHGTDGGV